MIDTIKRMICNLCKEEPQHPFTTLKHRSGQHIRNVLRTAFPDAEIKIADKEYSSPTMGEFNRWILRDCTSEYNYFKEYFDCDNFARMLRCAMFKINMSYKTEITMPYCEGDSPEGYHAFNAVVTSNDDVFIVEPQSDEVVPYRESVNKPDFVQL